MKKKLFAGLLVFALIGGCCGCQEAAQSAVSEPAPVEITESAAPEQVPEPAEQEVSESPVQEEPSAEEPVPLTGAVLSPEEAKERGYEVQYGMFDYETPVELPITQDGDHLSYWMYCQPYMMAYNVDMSKATFFREMEARTGVTIDLTAVSFFDSTDAFSLMMASGSYTDLLDGIADYYSGGVYQAVQDEIVVDFNEFRETDMPNYSAFLDYNSKARGDITNLDGSIGVAAIYTEGSVYNVGPQIRGDWLDELNLDMPVTYDDWHDVLTAFKNTYNATLWIDNAGTTRCNCYSAGYDTVLTSNFAPFVVDDAGVVAYAPATEAYRDYLRMLSSWYQEGLVYTDFFAQTVSTPDSSLVLNGNVGIWVSDAGEMQSYNEGGMDIRPLAQPRMEPGQQLYHYMATGGSAKGTSISVQCKDVELAAKWLDYLYTYDGVILCNYGVEGEGLQFDADGNPGYTDLVLHNPDMITIACIATYSRYEGAGIFYGSRECSGFTDAQWDAVDIWSDGVNADHDFPYGLPMTTEENERYATLGVDIQTVVSEQTLRFITGDQNLDSDWDAYIQNLEALHLDEYIAVNQTVYDRYLENSGA